MIDPRMFLHAELTVGVPEVRVVDRDGKLVLRFCGTSCRDAIKRGITFCDRAIEEYSKPKE